MVFTKLLYLSFLTAFILAAGQAEAQSPTAASLGFNIFVKGDVTLNSNETEGPIAIGGNLISNQHQISFNKDHGVFFVKGASIGLAVRGGVKLSSGSLQVNGTNYVKIGQCASDGSVTTNLKTWFKDNNNASTNIRITEDNNRGYDQTPNIHINSHPNAWGTPDVSDSYNPVCENVFGTNDPNKIDIDGAFIKLMKRSNQLRDLADNLPILDQNGNPIPGALMGPYLDPSVIGNNPRIIVNPNTINVLTVSAEVWNKIGNTNIVGIPSGPSIGTKTYTGSFGLIINIVDFPTFSANNGGRTKINFPSVGGLSDSQGSYVIYNFPDATKTVTLGGGTPIHGTIFTPCAHLIKENNGNINGQIIAKSYIHNGDEIHFWPFLPSIPEPAEKKIMVVATSKCFKNAPYLDYTITPSNFDATGKTAKFEWINSEGKIIQEDNGKALTGSILFPGAAVDIEGNGVAWPGWVKNGNKWEEAEDRAGSLRLTGATMRITVDPWTIVDITYPESEGSCYTSPPPGSTLPVTLASFVASNEDCDVQLRWTVTEAIGFSHFIVERSTDARTFTALSRVDYKSNQSEYSFKDSPYSSEASPSKHYYYRLQQVDTDESFEYSAIRSVEAGKCDARLSVDFYPNPTQDEVNVKSFSPLKKFEILTLGGKRVYEMSAGQNQTELKVNVQAFAQGLYIVNVVNAEGKYTSKILKK